MNYQQSLDYLYQLGHEVLAAHYRLGRMERLLAELGQPQRAYPSILIAGTNGKGSVAAMIESMLRRAGLRVGLYTSPHLVSVCERIKVAGRDISPPAFAEHATQVLDAARRLRERRAIGSMPTFFEHVTATGFSYFREQQIDLAVLEVGLGGRLDATNTVPPFLSVITRIDLDHEHILGSTLEQIAAEKAAIIKPGAVTVIGPQKPEVSGVIQQRCRRCRVTASFALDDPSRLWIHDAGEDGRLSFSYRSRDRVYGNIRLALRGYHQLENAIVAIETAAALNRYGCPIPSAAVMEGLENVIWPGRLEMLNGASGEEMPSPEESACAPSDAGSSAPTWPIMLMDGAHNLSGAEALRRYLDDFGLHPLTLIFGAMRDKRIEEMAATLFPLAQQIILTRVQDQRAADFDRLGRLAAVYQHVHLAKTVSEAVERALTMTPPKGMVCVTGSLYLVGDVKRWWAANVEPSLVSAS